MAACDNDDYDDEGDNDDYDGGNDASDDAAAAANDDDDDDDDDTILNLPRSRLDTLRYHTKRRIIVQLTWALVFIHTMSYSYPWNSKNRMSVFHLYGSIDAQIGPKKEYIMEYCHIQKIFVPLRNTLPLFELQTFNASQFRTIKTPQRQRNGNGKRAVTLYYECVP